jgi:hypothetical protein
MLRLDKLTTFTVEGTVWTAVEDDFLVVEISSHWVRIVS